MSRMNTTKLAGFAILGGIALTLLTGLIPFRSLLGAVHYGVPVPWLIRRIVAPEYFPWSIHGAGLAIDIVVWTLVVFVLMTLYDRLAARRPGAQPT